MKALPKRTSATEEPQLFTGHDEADSIDGVISTCYRLVGSFEQEIRTDQGIRCIPRANLARTLGEIADRAFALAWNTRDLTCIQQAQILDILLSVASLLDVGKDRLQDAVDQSEEASKQRPSRGGLPDPARCRNFPHAGLRRPIPLKPCPGRRTFPARAVSTDNRLLGRTETDRCASARAPRSTRIRRPWCSSSSTLRIRASRAECLTILTSMVSPLLYRG